MQLLTNICEKLISTNIFSLDKGKDLSAQLGHAWFNTQSPKHHEFTQAAQLLKQNITHPVVQFAHQYLPCIIDELVGRSVPNSKHPLQGVQCKSGKQERRLLLLFSTYAKHLVGLKTLKDKLYPFTGTFVSQTPVTLTLLRFLLEGSVKNLDYLDIRLTKCLDHCENSSLAEVSANLNGWNEYDDNLIESEIPPQAQHLLSNFLLNLG
ncbi:MAG: hypothetical protein ACJAS1_004367 [Oleiphilaceae bacterium]|jgi:hypothetical protein